MRARDDNSSFGIVLWVKFRSSSPMTKVPFVKYHGAGNDFILIDDREGHWGEAIDEAWIEKVCHRRFGIGADGLILLQSSREGSDFFMKYYNSDGRTSTFCGNGGRCLVAFASTLGIRPVIYHFLGTDGPHEAQMRDGLVELGMIDVDEIQRVDQDTYVLFTGSPHYVKFVDDIDTLDVKREGRIIRNSPEFVKEGINVNFVRSLGPTEINIRTYERGVEDETMACGTGVVAAALANAVYHDSSSSFCEVYAKGGELKVEFQRMAEQSFNNIKLIGPAVEVFRGEIEFGL